MAERTAILTVGMMGEKMVAKRAGRSVAH
jgi:hypothetical protein